MTYRQVILSVYVLTAFCGANATATVITNPSFEYEHDGVMPNGGSTSVHPTWGMPDDWEWRNSGHTNAHGIHRDDPVGWSSDGDWSLYVFASIAGPHVAGDYLEFYQTIDLSDVDEISFDVYLVGGLHTNSYLGIDSENLWVHNQAGSLYDVTVDVRGFWGLHEIELGVEVFEGFGSYSDGRTYFDNIVPEPATLLLLALGALKVMKRRRSM